LPACAPSDDRAGPRCANAEALENDRLVLRIPWKKTPMKREERERDCHIDLSNAAFFARSNLLDTDGAGNDLIKPTPAARDRCDKRGASLSADRASVLQRCRLGTMISRRRFDGGQLFCDCPSHRSG
jgi:hypothetical protein